MKSLAIQQQLSVMAAIQVNAPNELRGLSTVLLLLMLNLGRLALGSALIGWASQWLFPEDSAGIDKGFVLVGTNCSVLSALVARHRLANPIAAPI